MDLILYIKFFTENNCKAACVLLANCYNECSIMGYGITSNRNESVRFHIVENNVIHVVGVRRHSCSYVAQ